jgi:hypothetical protein
MIQDERSNVPVQPSRSILRVLLVLGRISNLPTVWSNCLAAWTLAGGSSWPRLILVCLGASCLYTGGMFLNDAVDEAFDRRYRPERPIVAGRISARAVWVLSCLWLAVGCGIFISFGTVPSLISGALTAAIVLYNVLHKRTIFSPVLMAACRFLLYPLAAAVANQSDRSSIWLGAAALAAYIVGLSYLARGESTGARYLRWTLILLFIPALLKCIFAAALSSSLVLALLSQVGWTVWCLAGQTTRRLSLIPRGVAGLLAGITLVDLVASAGHGVASPFFCLFILAILLQRLAPAT